MEGEGQGAGELVGDGMGVGEAPGAGDGLPVGEAGEEGLDPGSTPGGDGVLVVVAAGVVVGGMEGGEVDVVSGDDVLGGEVVAVGDGVGEVVDGGGAVVIDGGAGEVEGVGVGVGARAATCEAACALAAGGATGGWAPSGTAGRPPLPFVPGGTGPGADWVGMTPVR